MSDAPELKQCPCGKVPERLTLVGQGNYQRWRYLTCPCGDWEMEYRNNYSAGDDSYELAVQAWNNAARADLARLPEWKPIDAAPRDRRILLAKIVGHPAHETAIWWVSIGEWSQRWDRWWDTVDPSGLAGPTHWMPLPRNVAGHEQRGTSDE